jgi:hypothetical protein
MSGGVSASRSVERTAYQDISTLARTVPTMLNLRDDPQGQDMARYLAWLLLKTETRERRGSLFRF